MSGPQTFHQKVTIPLVVILATVGGLFLVGTQLMNLNSTPVAEEPVPEASVSAAPINPADTSLFHHNPHCINKGRIPIEP